MKWLEVTIVTTEDACDAICEMLAQVGADGIAVNDPFEIKRIIDDPDSLAYADEGYIDSLGEEVTVKAYFAEFDDGIRLGAKSDEYDNPIGVGNIYANISSSIVSKDKALDILKERITSIAEFLPVGKGITDNRYVKDEDWANNWKVNYHAFDISDRITICPTWLSDTNNSDKITILMDPGSAFGTGTHETTSMCARTLDKLIKEDDKILDVGTGSGILAIICSKLGAKSVEAIDIDRLAVDVAVDNCKVNNCDNISCHEGELKDAREKSYDIIVANIIADVICMIASDVPKFLDPDGRFICSGIINTKKERVMNALKEAGFIIEQQLEENDWMLYCCKLRGT